MSGNLSRRDFVRNSVIGASTVALGSAGAARGFPANEKVQLGWIGIGGRWGNLIDEVLKHCPDARTAAVCDLIPERVERGKKVCERDKPNGYTDLRKMMDKEKLDGILVVTQPCAHAEVVVPVLEAGFHCFAEKPMDTTVEKVDAIVKAARKARCIYQIGTQRRYSPTPIAAMKIIHSGKVGKVMFMQAHWHWSWRGAGKVARDGGFLVEQASHHTDVMAWAMGGQAPVNCASFGRSQFPQPEGPNVHNEQQSGTIWQFPGGEIFSYTHLMLLPGKYTDEKLWVFCEKAAVDARGGLLNWCEQYPGIGKKGEELEERFAEDIGRDWGRGTKEELQDFVANVKTGGKRTPSANVETGRISTLMCIMGRMAMVDPEKNAYEPRLIKWKDVGTTTDPA